MPHFDRLWVVYKHSNAKRVKSKSYRCIELSLSTETTTDIETAAHVAHVHFQSGRSFYPALIVYAWVVWRWPIPKLTQLCSGFGILLPPDLMMTHSRRMKKLIRKISNECNTKCTRWKHFFFHILEKCDPDWIPLETKMKFLSRFEHFFNAKIIQIM